MKARRNEYKIIILILFIKKKERNLMIQRCECAPKTCPPCTTNPSVQIYKAVQNLYECTCAKECSLCPELIESVRALGLQQVKIHSLN